MCLENGDELAMANGAERVEFHLEQGMVCVYDRGRGYRSLMLEEVMMAKRDGLLA